MMECENKFIDWLSIEIMRAQDNAHESSRIAQNSYGAGYDTGRKEALTEVLSKMGEIWRTK